MRKDTATFSLKPERVAAGFAALVGELSKGAAAAAETVAVMKLRRLRPVGLGAEIRDMARSQAGCHRGWLWGANLSTGALFRILQAKARKLTRL
ncbi:hypothetical protein [Mesorhizobium sp.]|uniref:hypothetical protein n=1 Tax=Mesorhizobium sp. TaxID=1871066 RepID=UPI0025B8C601|nr:hypothetical protein [Mesorhizobium sp.]